MIKKIPSDLIGMIHATKVVAVIKLVAAGNVVAAGNMDQSTRHCGWKIG